MKAEIHPKYEDITATCSCGNVIQTRSTVCEDIHLEVCSNCHPFYTGKQKVIDSAGRIDRFNKRFKRNFWRRCEKSMRPKPSAGGPWLMAGGYY